MATRLHTRLGRTLAIAAAAAGVAAIAPPGAAGASSCGKRVVEDWYDGRIDGSYDPQCYRDALTVLPEDVRTYSSAQDDITAALYQRIKSLADRQPRRTLQATGQPDEAGKAEPEAQRPAVPGRSTAPAALVDQTGAPGSDTWRRQAILATLPLLVVIAVPLLVTRRGRWLAGRLRGSARPAR